MNCNAIREELTAYLDDELPAEERARVERHLQTCSPCRQEKDSLAKAYELLGQVPAPASSPGFARRFWARAGRGGRRRAIPWALPLAAAAAAAVVVAVLVLRSPGPATPAVPTAEDPSRPPEQAKLEITPEERQIIENLEILASEDFEAAGELDLLDRLDAVQELDDESLELLGERSGK